jgi:hypothetical protein
MAAVPIPAANLQRVSPSELIENWLGCDLLEKGLPVSRITLQTKADGCAEQS